MADMTDTLGRAGLTLGEALAEEENLDQLQAALVRERVIREVMRESGEERRHVEDMLDAMISMGQEAVLDLTEGEPTTLRAGLQRYVEELEGRDELQPRDRVLDDLSTLLRFPWPGLVLDLQRHSGRLEIVVGGEVVDTVYESDSRSVYSIGADVASAVHKALTSPNN